MEINNSYSAKDNYQEDIDFSLTAEQEEEIANLCELHKKSLLSKIIIGGIDS